jgi:adenylate cyclase
MEKRIAELNAEWAGQGRQAMRVGIGVNAGEVFAGNIGSDRRLEYTVIGDAVNVAARLCAEAGGGEILIGESLYQRLTEPPPVTPLEPIILRGRARAVPVFRVDWNAHP